MFFKKRKKAENESASENGDDFVLVDDDETPDSETCTWEECIASIKVKLIFTDTKNVVTVFTVF